MLGLCLGLLSAKALFSFAKIKAFVDAKSILFIRLGKSRAPGQHMTFKSKEHGDVKTPDGFGKENRTRFNPNHRGAKRERDGANEPIQTGALTNRVPSTNGPILTQNAEFETLPPNWLKPK